MKLSRLLKSFKSNLVSATCRAQVLHLVKKTWLLAKWARSCNRSSRQISTLRFQKSQLRTRSLMATSRLKRWMWNWKTKLKKKISRILCLRSTSSTKTSHLHQSKLSQQLSRLLKMCLLSILWADNKTTDWILTSIISSLMTESLDLQVQIKGFSNKTSQVILVHKLKFRIISIPTQRSITTTSTLKSSTTSAKRISTCQRKKDKESSQKTMKKFGNIYKACWHFKTKIKTMSTITSIRTTLLL